MKFNVEEIVGKSIQTLSEEDLKDFYNQNDDVEVRATPLTTAPVSFLASYLASETIDCGSDK
ncbi:hypothetical protein BU657_08845 [Staphylococcus chromogenes]|uniref:hypothetical protein n=1 Tax=Staphylococcus chromogenes TaxID=46126 RepID=UPI000D1AA2D1|nr:hypothetical protein [Staphylococcus chromogenes]PTG77720.1 hypothetical protein BU657_08845 [Staphylococcus chromogenes]RIM14496.1 hypothetical protein BU672_11425 [Staphylococcus chromogenes]